MESKTIFEWAQIFQEQIHNGASQSDIIQMLEEYGSQALRIHDVGARPAKFCQNCEDFEFCSKDCCCLKDCRQ